MTTNEATRTDPLSPDARMCYDTLVAMDVPPKISVSRFSQKVPLSFGSTCIALDELYRKVLIRMDNGYVTDVNRRPGKIGPSR